MRSILLAVSLLAIAGCVGKSMTPADQVAAYRTCKAAGMDVRFERSDVGWIVQAICIPPESKP